MSIIDTNQFNLPQDEAGRTKLKNAVQEASDSKLRSDSELSLRKEIAKEIKGELGISAKQFNKLVKAHHKGNIQAEAAEVSDIEAAYGILFKVAQP